MKANILSIFTTAGYLKPNLAKYWVLKEMCSPTMKTQHMHNSLGIRRRLHINFFIPFKLLPIHTIISFHPKLSNPLMYFTFLYSSHQPPAMNFLMTHNS